MQQPWGPSTPAHLLPFSFPRDDEELRKQVFAALRYGARNLFFDNVKRGEQIDSPALARLITSAEVEERVLQHSKNERRPNRALLLLTGNNVALKGDMNRRIIPVTLDARVEHPWRRKFDFDPVCYVLSRPQQLRIAGLELMLAAAGHVPEQPLTQSGFPDWDRLVRRTVDWIIATLNIGVGFADPIALMEGSYEDDT